MTSTRHGACTITFEPAQLSLDLSLQLKLPLDLPARTPSSRPPCQHVRAYARRVPARARPRSLRLAFSV